jgi:hypothetical protein
MEHHAKGMTDAKPNAQNLPLKSIVGQITEFQRVYEIKLINPLKIKHNGLKPLDFSFNLTNLLLVAKRLFSFNDVLSSSEYLLLSIETHKVLIINSL